MIHKNDILGMIELDETAKKVFLRMTREEQLLAILGMLSFLRSENATVRKQQLDFAKDFDIYKQEQRDYRMLRETEEKEVGNLVRRLITGDNPSDPVITRQLTDEELMSTTQKIAKAINNAFSSRFDRWITLGFGVLQTVITIVILAVLYLAFGGEVPRP